MVITESQPPIKLDDNGSISMMIIGGPKAWCSSAIRIIIHDMMTR